MNLTPLFIPDTVKSMRVRTYFLFVVLGIGAGMAGCKKSRPQNTPKPEILQVSKPSSTPRLEAGASPSPSPNDFSNPFGEYQNPFEAAAADEAINPLANMPDTENPFDNLGSYQNPFKQF
jgi:hypothetical protein